MKDVHLQGPKVFIHVNDGHHGACLLVLVNDSTVPNLQLYKSHLVFLRVVKKT